MSDSRDGDRPRYIDLIETYKIASKRTWKQITDAAGIDPSTRDQWFNGRTKNHPLVGIIRLCAELEVPPQALFNAVLDGVITDSSALRETLEERLARVEATLRELSLDELQDARQQAERALRGQIGAADAEAQGRRGRGDAPAREQ